MGDGLTGSDFSSTSCDEAEDARTQTLCIESREEIKEEIVGEQSEGERGDHHCTAR